MVWCFFTDIINLTLRGDVPVGAIVATALMIATGSTLGVIIGKYIIDEFSAINRIFSSVNDIVIFVIAGCFMAAISALIGAGALFLNSIITFNLIGDVWLTWFTGDLAGIVVVAPVLLLWFKK